MKLIEVSELHKPMYAPAEARESTAIITPCLNLNPRVVVPWLIAMLISFFPFVH